MEKTVPWQTWDEWLRVKRLLLSDTQHNWEDAIETVNVWTLRGKVPTSVEATAQLRRIQLTERKRISSTAEARMLYSIALLRFVNGIVDRSQKASVALSVGMLASNVQLPRLLVDLRHQSTHNKLPQLSVLKVAVKMALDWLKTFYWEKQAAVIAATRAKVIQIIERFRNRSRKDKFSESEFCRVLRSCASRNVISDVFSETFAQVLVEKEGDTDSKSNFEEELKKWHKLLHALAEFPTFLPSLCLHLSYASMNANPVEDKLLEKGIRWLKHIVTTFGRRATLPFAAAMRIMYERLIPLQRKSSNELCTIILQDIKECQYCELVWSRESVEKELDLTSVSFLSTQSKPSEQVITDSVADSPSMDTIETFIQNEKRKRKVCDEGDEEVQRRRKKFRLVEDFIPTPFGAVPALRHKLGFKLLETEGEVIKSAAETKIVEDVPVIENVEGGSMLSVEEGEQEVETSTEITELENEENGIADNENVNVSDIVNYVADFSNFV